MEIECRVHRGRRVPENNYPPRNQGSMVQLNVLSSKENGAAFVSRRAYTERSRLDGAAGGSWQQRALLPPRQRSAVLKSAASARISTFRLDTARDVV